MFAFFFDEDHPENASPFGPQFASKIIATVERMVPIPETRLLTGGLLHNSLVYEVERIVLGERKLGETNSRLGTQTRTQHSLPNYDRRISIICDLAETLSGDQSSLEEEILHHLASKNIWVIVTPNLSEVQARAVHESISDFGPYLGYAAIDPGNPLHRRLFLQSLFKDKAIGPQGLAFRRDIFDEDDDHLAFAGEYGSRSPPYVLRC